VTGTVLIIAEYEVIAGSEGRMAGRICSMHYTVHGQSACYNMARQPATSWSVSLLQHGQPHTPYSLTSTLIHYLALHSRQDHIFYKPCITTTKLGI